MIQYMAQCYPKATPTSPPLYCEEILSALVK